MSDFRLQQLEHRWRDDRSPRVFLQYADELRRAGQSKRAIEVLTEGLEHHPDSVSGMVALGRALLDVGEAPHAAEFLERALERDPSQYVANRLLVECWLRLGEPDKAADRLATCRLLTDRDPELDELAAEIDRLTMERRPAAISRERSTTAGDGESRIFDLRPPESLPGIDLQAPATGDARRVAGKSRDTPFLLWTSSEDAGAKILERFRAEGIFLGQAATSTVSEPSSEVPAAEELEHGGATTESEAETGRGVGVEPMFSLQSIGEEVEKEGELARESAEDAGLLENEPDDLVPPERDRTSTLGSLYLAQGHLDDAEREFRSVLDARPEDVVARQGLEEIARRRGPVSRPASATAPAVVEVSAPVGTASLSGGPTQRKIERLSRLLSGLREQRLARAHVS